MRFTHVVKLCQKDWINRNISLGTSKLNISNGLMDKLSLIRELNEKNKLSSCYK